MSGTGQPPAWSHDAVGEHFWVDVRTTPVQSVSPTQIAADVTITKGFVRPRLQIGAPSSPATPRPLGSMFKLHVLAAVARQLSNGKLRWEDKLKISYNTAAISASRPQSGAPTSTRFFLAVPRSKTTGWIAPRDLEVEL